ncbi:hypothetical protein PVOR_01495 [Paenibacillus vortex V453]|uniref:Uncharacterized protein n=2 Tax=Paenibacillus TaxID=44249 RepID=A0A2R9T2R6_9BACL|nr:hypothetical protein PVOR_01495 [Paenibacillus vortex V453]
MKTKITKEKKGILIGEALAILENELEGCHFEYEMEYHEVLYWGCTFKVRVNQKGILVQMDPVKDELGYEHSAGPTQITNKEIIKLVTPEKLSHLILDGLDGACQSLGMHISSFYKHLRREGYIVDGITVEYKQNKYCVSVLFDDEDGKYRLIAVEIFNGNLDNWEYKETHNLDVDLYIYLTDIANEMISLQKQSV